MAEMMTGGITKGGLTRLKVNHFQRIVSSRSAQVVECAVRIIWP